MSGTETKRLSKVAREFNVGLSTIVEFLHKKGFKIDENPNAKVSSECYDILIKEYSRDIEVKREKEKVTLRTLKTRKETVTVDENEISEETIHESDQHVIIQDKNRIINIEDDDIEEKEPEVKHEKEPEIKVEKTPEHKKEELFRAGNIQKEPELKILGKIDIETKPVKKEEPIVEIKEEPIILEKEEQKEEKIEKLEQVEDIVIEDLEKSESEVKVVGKIDLSSINQRTRPKRKSKEEKKDERLKKEREKKDFHKKDIDKILPVKQKIEEEIEEELVDEKLIPPVKTVSPDELGEQIFQTKVERLTGPTVLGKIELPEKRLIASSNERPKKTRKKKRRRIAKDPVAVNEVQPAKLPVDNKAKPKPPVKKLKRLPKREVNSEEVQKQIKETLSRLVTRGKSKGVKHRRDKREELREKQQAKLQEIADNEDIIRVTEFVTANEIAGMMNISVNQVIQACMSLGMFVSINQRLDAETISLVAEEFGHRVEFVSVELQESIIEIEDTEEQLKPRPPIVTVMGHVDHGKTSLLDYIRSTNIIAGEAGGITQHIGAYNVTLKDGKRITFLDTPGHEAFTAMRARGAQVTDIAIIVVSADDRVMPQTVEAINHAVAAGVPIIFAINKIDKPNANPEKIKEELANMNYLVEDWGGKYQSKDISAKIGTNVDSLMEEVFLAAEMLELKANPDKNAIGTIIESSLDKGRGYVSTVLISNGDLRVGDTVLAGSYFGKVKAIYNERNNRIDHIGPAEPGVILGLNGAPKAGDNLNVMSNEREAREIATKREQLQREQTLRTSKHITLDEIGRRLAIGNFQELNVIVKGDVDGSVEALSDSLLKLSTEEVQVNIIHKAVGQIAETDVMLAAASDAVIVGFQVRPSLSARKLAEKDGIEIRLYSIIYDAINEIKDSISGMLAPITKEEITSMVEVVETFKITKVGTIAGCLVRDGKIVRNASVRIIRDGIVVYTGTLGTLKRFKDDVKEVSKGFECGLNIDKYNDIKVGDIIESYETVEVKRN